MSDEERDLDEASGDDEIDVGNNDSYSAVADMHNDHRFDKLAILSQIDSAQFMTEVRSKGPEFASARTITWLLEGRPQARPPQSTRTQKKGPHQGLVLYGPNRETFPSLTGPI